METQQHQNIIEKQIEEEKNNHSIQLEQTSSPKHPSSPPSSSSSPSHEFSFTISLHSNSSTTIHDKSKPPSPSLALDLSPADDIFFHGHLLPLHLLSHFPSSPRFSTNSNDSFTLPIRELLQDEKIRKDTSSCNTSHREDNINININNTRGVTKDENKSNNTKASSFSLFGSSKGNHNNKEKHNKKKLVGYDMIQALKKYLKNVQLFRGRREKNGFHGEAYSRSGNLIRKNKPEVRGSRGEYSAPASMRASPTNSGLLLATGGSLSSSSSNNSSMEELQAAIQAAIAHCKNSIAKEDKLS